MRRVLVALSIPLLTLVLVPSCKSERETFPSEPPPPEPTVGVREGGGILAGEVRPMPASAGLEARVERVATFEHQVTGVAVALDGRTFVCFPRWTEDSPVSVAELLEGGGLRPYPDERWNSWRNTQANLVTAEDRWVCAQSVFADQRNHLWVVDPAAPGMGASVEGGPKLVAIDLSRDQVSRTIPLDPSVAPPGSYPNDVRISADGLHAFLTDSGARGALIVVDLESGAARRVLDGHPSTQAEKNVIVKTDGRELRRPDGRPLVANADGIALSADGEHLYWQALTGRTLYRLPTAALANAGLSPAELEKAIELVGLNGVADGLWIDAEDRMYVSALEHDAIVLRDGDRLSTLVTHAELRWPDTFAQAFDGTLYVTASRIQDNAWFRPESGPRIATALFRIVTEPETAALAPAGPDQAGRRAGTR